MMVQILLLSIDKTMVTELHSPCDHKEKYKITSKTLAIHPYDVLYAKQASQPITLFRFGTIRFCFHFRMNANWSWLFDTTWKSM